MTTYNDLYDIVHNSELSAADRFKQSKVLFMRRRDELSRRFSDLITQFDLPNSTLAAVAGGTDSRICHARAKTYNIAINSTALLCERLFDMSVHEFLWEEKPQPITLPKHLSAVVEALEQSKDTTRNELLVWAIKQAGKEFAAVEPVPNAPEPSTHNKFLKQCAARINALLWDQFITLSEFLSDESLSTKFRFEFCRTFEDLSFEPQKSYYTFNLIYMSMAKNIPIDYFVSENYAQHCPLMYQSTAQDNKPAAIESVKDPVITKIISELLTMNDDLQSYAIAKILVSANNPN